MTGDGSATDAHDLSISLKTAKTPKHPRVSTVPKLPTIQGSLDRHRSIDILKNESRIVPAPASSTLSQRPAGAKSVGELMKHIQGSDPRTFKCTSGEFITIRFAPQPANALSVITHCFKESCTKADQMQVVGNQFSFAVNEPSKLVQMFFFFIPGEPIGQCSILLTSSSGDTFADPAPVDEDTSGLIPIRAYIFEIH